MKRNRKKREQGVEVDEEEDIIIDPLTRSKMVAIFRNVFTVVPAAVADESLSSLSIKQKDLLQEYGCL